MTRVYPVLDDALGASDAVGLVQRIQTGEVSIPEVIEAAIARVERVDPVLNAMAFTDFDRARAEARHPRGGYFAGVPTAVKDNVDVAGMPTQEGTDAFVARTAPVDGDFARMLLATGPIVLGKTQMSEFGFNASAEHPRLGAVRNPWDPAFTAGASSAGSAALVAAGAVPFAHGNDGGGSIRIPAAVCGLVGLKPTRGRLPQDRLFGRMPVAIVTDGVLTRSVRDTAAFLREAERVYRNLALPPVGDVTRPARQRLRVAVVTRSLATDATAEVTEQTRRTAALLEELGHRVEEVPPPAPATFPDDFLLYWSMLSLFLLQTGRRAMGPTFDRGRVDGLTEGLARHCRRHLHRLPGALRRVARSHVVTDAWFREWDLTLAPTLGHATPLLGHLDPRQDYDVMMDHLLGWVTTTPWENATGCPAVSLPAATDERGLPMGMQLGAASGDERTLLEIAYEVEEAVGWPRLDQVSEDAPSA